MAELAPGQEAIHAYSLPDLRHTGTLADVKLGSHVGALALADGRVITTDDKHGEVIALQVDAKGAPAIVQRAAAELGSGAAWACGDAQLRYLAVSSGIEGSSSGLGVRDCSLA